MRRTLAIAAALVLLVGCSRQPVADDPPVQDATTPPGSSQPSATETPARTTTPTSTPTPKATPADPARDKAITEAKQTILDYMAMIDKYAKNPDPTFLPPEVQKIAFEEEQQSYLINMKNLKDQGIHIVSGNTAVHFHKPVEASQGYTDIIIKGCIDASRINFNKPIDGLLLRHSEKTWQLQNISGTWHLLQLETTGVRSCS